MSEDSKIRITSDFLGGNIKVISISDSEAVIENEIRDSADDWFYWAFCVEGAEGKTIHFRFDKPNRVGYYGAAVSNDLINWRWTESKSQNCEGFTYKFSVNERRVYFAHHMLYHPDRFASFAKAHGIKINELCKTKKGRSVPYITVGTGEKNIIVTARHHCCESTGNYLLEGFLEQFANDPIDGYRVMCVPFVDFDGVVDGDQGKSRMPHDHNRDYDRGAPSIYTEVAKIREYADSHNTVFGFDFHSPWHLGGVNDEVFIPQKSFEVKPRLDLFGECFEQAMTDNAMQYHRQNDVLPNEGWNKVGTPCFATYILGLSTSDIAFTLETTYFGKDESKFSIERATATGRCFYNALNKYISKNEN